MVWCSAFEVLNRLWKRNLMVLKSETLGVTELSVIAIQEAKSQRDWAEYMREQHRGERRHSQGTPSQAPHLAASGKARRTAVGLGPLRRTSRSDVATSSGWGWAGYRRATGRRGPRPPSRAPTCSRVTQDRQCQKFLCPGRGQAGEKKARGL